MPIPWMLEGYLIASFMPVGGWDEVDVIRGDVCQDTELATATLPQPPAGWCDGSGCDVKS